MELLQLPVVDFVPLVAVHVDCKTELKDIWCNAFSLMIIASSLHRLPLHLRNDAYRQTNRVLHSCLTTDTTLLQGLIAKWSRRQWRWTQSDRLQSLTDPTLYEQSVTQTDPSPEEASVVSSEPVHTLIHSEGPQTRPTG